MAWILKILLNNLLIVFIIEIPLAVVLGARKPKQLVTVTLANVITNPVVVFLNLVVMLFAQSWSVPVLVASEILAVITEGFIFSKFKVFKKMPFIISLVLNSASFLVGEVIDVFY